MCRTYQSGLQRRNKHHANSAAEHYLRSGCFRSTMSVYAEASFAVCPWSRHGEEHVLREGHMCMLAGGKRRCLRRRGLCRGRWVCALTGLSALQTLLAT